MAKNGRRGRRIEIVVYYSDGLLPEYGVSLINIFVDACMPVAEEEERDGGLAEGGRITLFCWA